MAEFPFYKQHDAMQCGITCLRMVCKYFGKEFSSDRLSGICFATNEGVSILGISEAAEKIGLHTLCGKFKVEQLTEISLPCILHWNQNHFVVLYKIKKKKWFYIADPAQGLVKYPLKEFCSHWLSTKLSGEEIGIAILIQTTPVFYEYKNEDRTKKRSFKLDRKSVV